MPSKTIRSFNGSVILESKVLRTNQEQKFYGATWEVNVSGRNLIARIPASAGLTDCPGHFLVFQLDWQWKMLCPLQQ